MYKTPQRSINNSDLVICLWMACGTVFESGINVFPVIAKND